MVEIKKYFPELTKEQATQFAALRDLYVNWNAQINVISRKDMDYFYTHHVLHSLAIAKVNRFLPGTTVLDVGTGGGFPGIPLAILMPDVRFHCVDSIGKKIKVVNAVIDDLKLENVKTAHGRAEDLHGKYDFIVSRAVAQLEPFYRWIEKRLNNKTQSGRGLYALKGGDLVEEILNFKKRYPRKNVTTFEIGDYFSDEYFQTKKVVYVC